jgi:hypothetical protein
MRLGGAAPCALSCPPEDLDAAQISEPQVTILTLTSATFIVSETKVWQIE